MNKKKGQTKALAKEALRKLAFRDCPFVGSPIIACGARVAWFVEPHSFSGASTTAFIAIAKTSIHLHSVRDMSTKRANLQATRDTVGTTRGCMRSGAGSKEPLFGLLDGNLSSATLAM